MTLQSYSAQTTVFWLGPVRWVQQVYPFGYTHTKTLPLATSVNSTAATISPWRSGYLSKLCLQPHLLPTPDKRPCKASVYLPSASSFPCARAQGDERSLRHVIAPQTIEVAKDGKYSYLHQPFPGRADSQLPSLKLPDQPTLAQAHITTLRQPTTMRCCFISW